MIYLDYAAATPVDTKVAKTIASCEKRFFANPSAIHALGVEAKKIENDARTKIAMLINAHKDEIIFTGSGTESNALAILGVLNNYREKNKHESIPHIITTTIEHPAVLENCKMLEREGKAEVTYVPVNEFGVVDPREIKEALKENTVLVSVMYANNEIGTIQPIQEIAKVIRHFNKMQSAEKKATVLFHTDACQAMNYLFTENIEKLGVDLLSFNSSKIYGPKGLGVLFKKRGVTLAPIYSGGRQEFGLRSGTENVAGIAGLAEAFEITCAMKEKESVRLTKIRDYGIEKLLALSQNFPETSKNEASYKIILNGDKVNRLPNNINISISGISSELLVIELSAKGIMVSSKSACKSDDPDESYVISALRYAQGSTPDPTSGSLRISLGRETRKSDMEILANVLKSILEKYKNLTPVLYL
jgi:cysteine desulfurase